MSTPANNMPRHLPYAVSVIVPIYKEQKNLKRLIERSENSLNIFKAYELILVDDNSQDGTAELIERIREEGKTWVHLHTRTQERGLSTAVIYGLKKAKYDNLIVMDGDLSHPPESFQSLVLRLNDGETDFVIGSRYVEGGQVHANWSFFRNLNSKIAMALARPFTNARDPMSGFFCLHRFTFERASKLNPLGYKIGIELIVKCACKNVKEESIFFDERYQGESKISKKTDHLREVLYYLRHVNRLAKFKFGTLAKLFEFAVIGSIGFLFNLILLTFFLSAGINFNQAIFYAISFSLIHNYSLYRLLTYWDRNRASFFKGFQTYFIMRLPGACMVFLLSTWLFNMIKFYPEIPQISASIGIIAGAFVSLLTIKIFQKHNQKDLRLNLHS